MDRDIAFQTGDLLLIVDPQMDFMPGGTLAIPGGDEIIPLLNEYLTKAIRAKIPIAISRDWHPPNHISFQEQGGPWPVHCVQNTPGAAFHPDIRIPPNALIVNKAFHSDREAYSALEGVVDSSQLPFTDKLNELGIRRIWIAGLALDYCVYHSAMNGHDLGYEFHVILAACRGITDNATQKALENMRDSDIILH